MKFTRSEHATERWKTIKESIGEISLHFLIQDITMYVLSPEADQLEHDKVYEVIRGDILYILHKKRTATGQTHYQVVTLYRNNTPVRNATYVSEKTRIY